MSQSTVTTINYIRSYVKNVRKLEDKQMCSFHKRQVVSFNATTLERANIRPGMYARFGYVDMIDRAVYLFISKTKPNDIFHWYKVCNPMVNDRNTYCYIRTTDLQYDKQTVLYGAFNFTVEGENTIVIHF